MERVAPEARVTATVLLHGFLGAPSAWDEVVALLGPGAEAHALTLPGHGPTPWSPAAAAAAGTTFEAAIDAFARRLPDRAHLVGYSMGARVALGVAARHPERVASLVLVGLNPGLTDEAERVARRAWDEALAQDLEQKGLEAFVDAWEKLPLFATQATLPETTRARRRAERLAHVPAALAWAQRTLGLGAMPPLGAALAALAVPVHLVTGATDEKFTELARRVAAHAPAVLHTVVPATGHDVGLEAPRALAEILRTARTGA
jgi:2-succinyl-6-hydroxy-2,4-cyclohexadiene-1-carboxylate synthase